MSKSRKIYEVFFRYVFTSVHPYGYAASSASDAPLVLPIKRLSHITHNKEAEAIKHGRDLSFKPKPKKGKAYKWDGSPIGESFRDDFIKPTDSHMPPLYPTSQVYEYILDSELLLPKGYYSWWGLSTREEKSHDLRFPPPYLASQSLYGNREFSGDLSMLLRYYRNSHPSVNEPEIYLLRGGTLRYKREICYIVIVCTEEQRNSEALREYPPLQTEQPTLHQASASVDKTQEDTVLDMCGLTDETGKILDYSGKKSPIFYPKNLSTKESWENLAFAFYFTSENTILACSTDGVTENAIDHDPDRCLKKQPPEQYVKWCCPNDM